MSSTLSFIEVFYGSLILGTWKKFFNYYLWPTKKYFNVKMWHFDWTFYDLQIFRIFITMLENFFNFAFTRFKILLQKMGILCWLWNICNIFTIEKKVEINSYFFSKYLWKFSISSNIIKEKERLQFQISIGSESSNQKF